MATDDSYTKALLHFSGADASTTITDESGKTWTRRGTAQIDTAQYKFGGASLLLDGDSDWVDTPDSDDFYFSNGAFTIECFVRLATGYSKEQIIFNQVAGDAFITGYIGGSEAYFNYYTGSAYYWNYGTSGASIAAGTWYHIVFQRDGTDGNVSIYVDGTRTQKTPTGDPANLTSVFRVGSNGSNRYVNGWIDEFRLSKGIARYSGASFTPPTYEFQTPARMARGLIIG